MRTGQGSLEKFEVFAKFDLISRKQEEVYEFYEHFRAIENVVWTIFAKLRNIRRKSQHLLILKKVGCPEMGR